jgi:hypothetical protein
MGNRILQIILCAYPDRYLPRSLRGATSSMSARFNKIKMARGDQSIPPVAGIKRLMGLTRGSLN